MKKKFSIDHFTVGVLLTVPLIFGILSVKLGQDTNWDIQNYHLYNPYAYLNDRINYDLAPAGLQNYFNPFIDVVYYKAIGLLNSKLLGFILGYLQGLNFIILYNICQSSLKPLKISSKISLFLAFAGILTVGFLSEVGTTFHDSLIAVCPLTALWIITYNSAGICENKLRPILIVFIAGFIVGAGAGLKLVVIVFAAALSFSFFVLPVSWRIKFRLSVIFGIGTVLGFLATGGYWTYFIWENFGNPLFPQFNHIFHGGLAVQDVPIRDERFLPKSLFERLFYPVIFTLNPNRVSELQYKQIGWITVYISLLILGIHYLLNFFRKTTSLRSLTPEVKFVITYFCLSFALWLNIFGIYRYLISIELLLPLVLFLIAFILFESKLVHLGSIIMIGIMTLINLKGVPNWGRASWADNVSHLELIPSDLQDEKPVAIFLGGQPLAWIIPLIDPKAPVIQVAPNFAVSGAYWQRAKTILDMRSPEKKMYIILESESRENIETSNKGLSNMNLSIEVDSCKPITPYIGAQKFEYKYCEVKDIQISP